jgi:hypothetical protein
LLEQINVVLGEQADALLHRLHVSRSGIFGWRYRHTGFSWLLRREPGAAAQMDNGRHNRINCNRCPTRDQTGACRDMQ